MVISEPHRACILNFALDRERVGVVAVRDSKQDSINLSIFYGAKLCQNSRHFPVNVVPASSRQSSTWFVPSAAEA